MSAFREIQVMYLVNVDTDEGIKTQIMTKTVDPVDLFGDDDVAQINGFFVRMNWQPETPIEYKPSPYYLG